MFLILAIKSIVRKPPPLAHASLGPQGTVSRIGSEDKSRQLAILGGIASDKYPKPDFGRWNPYRPEPGMAKGLVKREPAALPVSVKVEEPESTTTVLQVPEALSTMIAMLPRKSLFTGPMLNANEVIQYHIF